VNNTDLIARLMAAIAGAPDNPLAAALRERFTAPHYATPADQFSTHWPPQPSKVPTGRVPIIVPDAWVGAIDGMLYHVLRAPNYSGDPDEEAVAAVEQLLGAAKEKETT
jgi:hypothetical protein